MDDNVHIFCHDIVNGISNLVFVSARTAANCRRIFRLHRRRRRTLRPLRGIRAVGIPFRRKAMVCSHILIITLQKVLHQPLTELGKILICCHNIGVASCRLHKLGHFGVQSLRRAVIIKITVAQMGIKTAAPDSTVQYRQGIFIERDRSDHPFCRKFRGDLPPGDAEDVRQIILRAASLHELKYIVSFLIKTFQSIIPNPKGAIVSP